MYPRGDLPAHRLGEVVDLELHLVLLDEVRRLSCSLFILHAIRELLCLLWRVVELCVEFSRHLLSHIPRLWWVPIRRHHSMTPRYIRLKKLVAINKRGKAIESLEASTDQKDQIIS